MAINLLKTYFPMIHTREEILLRIHAGSKTVFDSGLSMDLLQDYIFISLDIFRSKMHNKKATTLLEAWMTYFSTDDPEEIVKLITDFPQFKPMYETLYRMCQNVENVMGFFSEELRELDRNTVRYMIDELQKEVDSQKALLREKDAVIAENTAALAEKDSVLAEKDAIIADLQAKLAEK